MGVILSHTKMGGTGICTNIAVKENNLWRQIRIRNYPNGPINIRHFGYGPQDMNGRWQPGRVVEFTGFNEIESAHKRITHPEDVIMINHAAAVMHNNVLNASQFDSVVASFTYPSALALYPNLKRQKTNSKGWMEPTVANPRSVGYLRCDVRIRPVDDKGKYSVWAFDNTGFSFVCSLKDELLLNKLRTGTLTSGTVFNNALVRFSLSDKLTLPEVGDRCYVMLSHLH